MVSALSAMTVECEQFLYHELGCSTIVTIVRRMLLKKCYKVCCTSFLLMENINVLPRTGFEEMSSVLFSSPALADVVHLATFVVSGVCAQRIGPLGRHLPVASYTCRQWLSEFILSLDKLVTTPNKGSLLCPFLTCMYSIANMDVVGCTEREFNIITFPLQNLLCYRM